MARLETEYKEKIIPALQKQFGYKSVMEVPKLTKITLNMGVGAAVADKKVMQAAVSDMEKIAGQRPVVTLARKSIAGFKIRDDMAIGCKVTLRSDKMYEFLDRLISIAIPRIRDFRGMSPKSFDGRGNYSMGVTEQIIFPEIDYDKIDTLRGMDISITTTAGSNEEGLALLKLFNFPFKN
jgi:large subunit ribosomal protein L5